MNKKQIALLFGTVAVGYTGVFLLKVMDIVKVVAQESLEDTKMKNHTVIMEDLRELDKMMPKHTETIKFWEQVSPQDPS